MSKYHWGRRLFMAIALLFSTATFAQLAEIKERQLLKVGVSDHIYPFAYQDEAGQWQGLEVALAKQLAKDLLGDENKALITPVPNIDRIAVLKAKEQDLILATFSDTATRRKVVDFASPYLNVSIGLITPADKKINAADELSGKKIIVLASTTAEKYFKENFKDSQLQVEKTVARALAQLANGHGDGLAFDNVALWAWARKNPQFAVSITAIGEQQPIAPAVDKDNDLRDWLNEELVQLRANGTMANLYQQTLAEAFSPEELAKIIVP